MSWAGGRSFAHGSKQDQLGSRSELMNRSASKCCSLSVATMQPFAPATEAMIMSSARCADALVPYLRP